MKQHLCVIWEQDMAVSVIGPEAEQLFKIHQYYHEEELRRNIGYPDLAVQFANWCSKRGYKVYLYTIEKGPVSWFGLKTACWAGKQIGEVSRGVLIRRPKTAPDITHYLPKREGKEYD